MWSLGTLLLGATLAYSYTIIDSDDPSGGIIWPSEYHLKGVEMDLGVSIEKKFEIWYSAELNRSRISYYDKLDSTYYYGETEDTYGEIYQIYPMADADLDIGEMCDSTSSDDDAKDFLPAADNFTFTGMMTYDDKEVAVWELSDQSDEDHDTVALLYVYRHDEDFDVPVRYEVKKYDKWTKALLRHKISEYHSFKLPEESDLDISKVEACNYANVGTDLHKALKFFHPDSRAGLQKAFHAYKRHHKRQYDDTEHEMRLKIFQENWRKVIDHNQKNLSYKMEINKFSDRTPEELKYLTATLPNPLGKGSVEFPHSEKELEDIVQELPESYNMRLDGVITGVKDQGFCGSCWAFTTTAAVEGALARANGGRDLDLSEQSLVDCAWGYNNYGCDGGMLDSALKYVLEYGIPTEREYGPYLEQDGNCAELNMTKVFTIKGFARVPPLGVNAMKVALYKYGPVAVAIYASDNLSKYSSGIFFDTECETEQHINHAVTVVGYGVRDGTLYWIVKNSWGEEWGQDGYFYMSATNDNCLLLTEAYYPIV